MIAAGCGSDDDESSDAATTTAAPAATSAAATSAAATTASSPASSDGSSADVTAAPAADGEPIRLMSIYVKNNPAFSQPQTFAGAQARVDAINADGGVNGRPIQLIGCDSNLDPNQEKACIDQAISEQVSAVVSSSIFFTPLTSLEGSGHPIHRRPGHHAGSAEQPDLLSLLRRTGLVPGAGCHRRRRRGREHHDRHW